MKNSLIKSEASNSYELFSILAILNYPKAQSFGSKLVNYGLRGTEISFTSGNYLLIEATGSEDLPI